MTTLISLHSKRFAKDYLHIFILTVAFPLLLGFVVYYGFLSNYTGDSFHEAGFRKQYEHGIYKYRILGRILLLQTHEFMKSNLSERVTRGFSDLLPTPAKILDNQADGLFYGAYFIQNTFFLILSSSVLWFILTLRSYVNVSSVRYSHMIGTLLMAITQYVVTPYDTLSYFFILLSFLLIIKPFRFSYFILLLILIISTLTRESSALTLAFFFAHHYRNTVGLSRKEMRQLAGLVAAFLATYISIRFQLGFDHSFYQEHRLRDNLGELHGLVGILALPMVACLICTGSQNPKKSFAFTFACAPYLLGMIVIGSTWEMRLWVPFWLGLLILTRDISPQGILQPAKA